MGVSTLRRLGFGLAMTLGLASGAVAAAEAPPLSPDIARQYIQPHDRIDIGDGRRLNLFCMGEGARTVLFDSGGSDWSVIWALVQPELARDARVCTYDRAGLGYSDPAEGPRSPFAVVEDMHALIHAARLRTPLVLVGHSLGGFNVKLYAALYPEDVAGLVLVDPSEERSGERMRAFLRSRSGAPLTARLELLALTGIDGLMARYRRCAELARERALDPASDDYRRCSDPVRPPLGPLIAAERQRIQVTPAYQQAQASEILNSLYGDPLPDPTYASLFVPGSFGDRPMIVLTHGLYNAADPLDAADFAGMVELHRESAALSRRGRQRVVPDTHHNIEIDAPQAVVEAVREVLGELR